MVQTVKDDVLRNAAVLLFDRKHHVRRQARSMLNAQQIWTVTELYEPYHLPEALKTSQVHLLIAAIEEPADEVLEMVTRLRRMEYGGDPFIPVILTSWNSSRDLVGAALNSGADDLLIWPFSIKQLGDRIWGLIRNRKRYVLTDTYLGPDRRMGQNRGTPFKTVDVPNTLRAVIEDELEFESTEETVANAMMALRSEKIRCEARRIHALTSSVMESYHGERADDIDSYLNTVHAVAGQFQRSIVGSSFEHLSRLAVSISMIVQDMLANWGEVAERDMALLEKTARALYIAAETDNTVAAAALDISEEIRRLDGSGAGD
ncbi:MAG TPA: response regulator [Alphaproteobacteria bacterium]|nr:response regulator [Alphaproteobacteria bacterium]